MARFGYTLMTEQGRFILGRGSGENLNEHTVGRRWPAIHRRQDVLAEAVQVIRALHTGRLTTWAGEHYRADSARTGDCPDEPVPIGIAVSGEKSIDRFAAPADHLITTPPDPAVVQRRHDQHPDTSPSGRTTRVIRQVPICWAPTRDDGVRLAHDQFQQQFLDEAAEPLLDRLRGR